MNPMAAPGAFYNAINICYKGVCSEYQVPWVRNFNEVQGVPAAVLAFNLGKSYRPGLYAHDTDTKAWYFAIPYSDMCSYVADSYSFSLQLQVTSSQSYPAGTIIYRNGQQIAGTTITPDATAVYAVVQPSAGGGGGGGDSSFTYTNLPSDLPTPDPGDPEVILNNGATPVSTLQYKPLVSIGGQSLGMVLVGVGGP